MLVAELKQENIAISSSNEELQRQLATRKREAAEKLSEQQRESSQNQATQAALRCRIEQLENDQAILSRRLATVQQERQQTEERLSGTKEALRDLFQQRSAHAKEIQQNAITIRERDESVRQLTIIISERDETVRQLTAALVESQQLELEAQQSIAALTEQNDQLRLLQVTEKDPTVADMQRRLDEADAEKQDLKQQLLRASLGQGARRRLSSRAAESTAVYVPSASPSAANESPKSPSFPLTPRDWRAEFNKVMLDLQVAVDLQRRVEISKAGLLQAEATERSKGSVSKVE